MASPCLHSSTSEIFRHIKEKSPIKIYLEEILTRTRTNNDFMLAAFLALFLLSCLLLFFVSLSFSFPTFNNIKRTIKLNKRKKCVFLPVQVPPTRMYPGLQRQVYPPGKLKQSSISLSQSSVCDAHSFMSEMINIFQFVLGKPQSLSNSVKFVSRECTREFGLSTHTTSDDRVRIYSSYIPCFCMHHGDLFTVFQSKECCFAQVAQG